MKKRILLLVLLLATVVYAQNGIKSDYERAIPEYHDFPLDNIHILRLQDAAASLGGNVTELRQTVEQMEERRSTELSQLQGSFDSFQRSMTAQVAALQSSIESVGERVDGRSAPVLEVPANVSFPPYLMILLGVNVFLLVLVIILIFWLREQYYVHRETHKEEHIHPAPAELTNYVKHQLEHKKSLHDVRMELAGKGWTPSIIEHAIHAAKEK